MWTNFMAWATTSISQLRNEDEGQTLVEYALIIVLVSVALVATLVLLKTGIGGAFTKAINALA